MTTLLIATRNAHKLAEIRAILGDELRYLTLIDFPDAPSVVEDADSFAGNATRKALELARWLSSGQRSVLISQSKRCFVLADDSGLEVDALNGDPGVHSARFAALDRSADRLSASAGGNSPDIQNNAKLMRLLKLVPWEKRTARFRCVIAVVEINRQSAVCNPQCFDGACEGRIIFKPRGHGGFGYDPLFVPNGYERTFAELGEDVKNRLSHRARALNKLKAAWFG